VTKEKINEMMNIVLLFPHLYVVASRQHDVVVTRDVPFV